MKAPRQAECNIGGSEAECEMAFLVPWSEEKCRI